MSSFNKDAAHAERKRLESDLRGSIFSKDKMDQRDCKSEHDEHKRVNDYVEWKETRGRDGMTNEQKMNRYHEINREFKKQGIEGAQIHTSDQLRNKKRIIYE